MIMIHGLGLTPGATSPQVGTTGEVGWNDYTLPPPPPRPPSTPAPGLPVSCPSGQVLSKTGCITPYLPPPPKSPTVPGQQPVPNYVCANGAVVSDPRMCQQQPQVMTPPMIVATTVIPPNAPPIEAVIKPPMTATKKAGIALGVLAAGAGIAALIFGHH